MNGTSIGLLAAVVASAGLHVVVLGFVPEGDETAGAPNLSRVVVGTSESLFGADVAANAGFSVVPQVNTGQVAEHGQAARTMPVPDSSYPQEFPRDNPPAFPLVAAASAADAPTPYPSLAAVPFSVSAGVTDAFFSARGPERFAPLYAALVTTASAGAIHGPADNAAFVAFGMPDMMASLAPHPTHTRSALPAVDALGQVRAANAGSPLGVGTTAAPHMTTFLSDADFASARAFDAVSVAAFAPGTTAGIALDRPMPFIVRDAPRGAVAGVMAKETEAAEAALPSNPAAVSTLGQQVGVPSADATTIALTGADDGISRIAAAAIGATDALTAPAFRTAVEKLPTAARVAGAVGSIPSANASDAAHFTGRLPGPNEIAVFPEAAAATSNAAMGPAGPAAATSAVAASHLAGVMPGQGPTATLAGAASAASSTTAAPSGVVGTVLAVDAEHIAGMAPGSGAIAALPGITTASSATSAAVADGTATTPAIDAAHFVGVAPGASIPSSAPGSATETRSGGATMRAMSTTIDPSAPNGHADAIHPALAVPAPDGRTIVPATVATGAAETDPARLGSRGAPAFNAAPSPSDVAALSADLGVTLAPAARQATARTEIAAVLPMTAFDLYKQGLRSALADALAEAPAPIPHGTVVFALGIEKNGALRFAQVSATSGDTALDAEALRILRSAAPFRPVPDELGHGGLALHFTFTFPGEIGT